MYFPFNSRCRDGYMFRLPELRRTPSVFLHSSALRGFADSFPPFGPFCLEENMQTCKKVAPLGRHDETVLHIEYDIVHKFPDSVFSNRTVQCMIGIHMREESTI
jgi:hypothetical protein